MSRRVLVIDDNTTFCGLLSDILATMDCKVIAAHNAKDGLALALNGADMIITDIRLPDGDGWQIVKRLKSDPRTSKIPVIICSAPSSEPLAENAAAMGAADFIPKPFQIKDFIERIKRVMPHGS